MRRRIKKLRPNVIPSSGQNEVRKTYIPPREKLVRRPKATSHKKNNFQTNQQPQVVKHTFTITEALYESNETFSNSIRTNAKKDIFFKCLQSFCKNKFNEAKKSGKPIVNMVFHGHWGWVFSKMIKEYRKHNTKFEIVCSVHPIPEADVYQYWRPVSKFAQNQYSRITDITHPFWVKGVHMMHDSPYDNNRSKTNVRLLTLGRVNHALCTSLEQKNYFDGVVKNTKCWYVPLGTNEKLEPKEPQVTKGKIKLGFIGRLYWDKVKGEDKLLELASKLDPNKFEFVILSPNAEVLIKKLRERFKVYTTNDGGFEKVFNRIDVTIVLSKYEGTPLPLIESLQIGIYVLSTKVGEAPSLLNDKDILSSVDQFYERLNYIYDNRKCLQQFKSKGPKLTKDRTWKSFVEKSIKIWESIL